MSILVSINDAVSFSPSVGVLLGKGAAHLSPAELHHAVQIAFRYINEPVLIDAACGGVGPLASYSNIDFNDFLAVVQQAKAQEATFHAKKTLTKYRRQQFNAARDALALRMIDAGIPYVCVREGCGESEELTIDHIVPLSRGGSDELTNLRFMCRSHNAQKGDRLEAGA